MKIYYSLILVFFAWTGFSQSWLEKMHTNGNVFEAKQEFDAYWADKTVEKGTGYKQFLRWYEFWAPRTFPSGDFSKVNQKNGLEQHFLTQKTKNYLKSSTSTWSSVERLTTPSGYNGLGRINVIEFHPTDPDTWFIGTPGGGLWKTTDGGSSWTPLTDYLTNLGISDIAIANGNPDIIYIATGDRDARDTYSFGVMKSTDGGVTWNSTGLSSMVQNGWTTNRILIHPTNDNILLVASGNGIYRSIDGANSFTLVEGSGNYISMEFNPTDPNIVYASQYDYWNEQAAFYRSTDNGINWSQVSSGLPANNCRRIQIAVSPANSNYVYLVAVNNENGLEGIYRSTNSGVSFGLMTSSPNVLHSGDGSGTGGQGWYDLSLAVSTIDANEIYVGGINLWKSTNGGTTFSKMTHWYNDGSGAAVIHADQHWFSFENNTLFVCNDGGLYASYDGGNSFSDFTNGLAITQYYRISNDQNNNDRLIAGAQDNGTDMFSSSTWADVNGGDGMQCLIDYTDPNIVFSAVQYGNIYRSTDGGNSFNDVSPDPDNGAWITPYEMDPTDHNIMYCGYNDIYKSTDNGISWTQTTSGLSTELLRHIHISKSNNNVVYCASYEQLFKSTDGGNSFIDVTGTLPVNNASISSICIDPSDENRVWVTFSGYSSGEKVFRTDNGASTWANQSGTLPNLPVNVLICQEGSGGILFAGTDVGVYWYDPQLSTWDIYGLGLPNVIIYDLDIQYNQEMLRAATFGRGVWEIGIQSTLPPTANYTSSTNSICEGNSISYTNQSLQGDTYLWTFDGGTPATSTSTNPTVSYNTSGSYDVKLVAYNQNGADSLEMINYIQVAANDLDVISLGNASNIYTNLRNGTHPIVVNNDLNTVAFVHRQNTNEHSGTSGSFRYDYSTDDGQTWTIDEGILNTSAVAGTNDGRYPQLNIYNPTSNTNPANAKIVYYGPTVGSSWNGYVTGDGNLGGGIYTENYNEGTPSNTLIPHGLTNGANGTFWTIDEIYDGANISGFQTFKGTWNGSNIVWTTNNTFTPDFNTTYNGSPFVGDFNIAFDPTGQNGWIVFLSHLNGSINNYQYYPIFYQTTDGGNTWSGPIEVDLSTFPVINTSITGGGVPSSAYNIDIAVDENGNPHTLFNVCSGAGADYSINNSEWMGACHVHHNGTSWEADTLASISTLRYTLTDGASMDNTPHLVRSDDGKTIVFVWSDSDPSLTGGANSLPYMNIVAYNVVTDFYSDHETADICSMDPGKIAFLHTADRLLETSNGYEVAAVISDINSSGSGTDETGHKYFSYPIPNVCSATASFVNSSNTCVGETVNITDNSTSAGGYSYEWDIDNDGNTDYTTNGDISHQFTNTGSYTISLKLDNGNGCITSTAQTITVNSLPDLQVDFPSTICESESIDYIDLSNVSSPAVYDWDFDGDGNIDASTSGDQAYTPSITGLLSGNLIVTDNNGCENTLSLNVNIEQLPNVDFTIPSSACANESVTITDNSTSTTGYSYSWDIDNDNSEDYNNNGGISHSYQSGGTYTVNLSLENPNGCQSDQSHSIVINDLPVLNVSFPGVICDLGQIDYINSSTVASPATYSWDFDGDGNSDATSSGNQSYTPSNIGTLNGSLDVIDVNGCENSIALTVSVDIQPTADFTIPTQGCVGENISFTDNSLNSTNYSWDVDNNGSEDYNISGNISHIYSSANLYTVSLEVSNGNCTDTHLQQINIEDDPVVDFTAVHQGGTSYLFQDLTVGNGTYLWNFGDGNTSNTAGDVSHTYADENSHTVTLTVTNDCGNNSHVETTLSSTSVDEMSDIASIFPNPTTGLITIEVSSLSPTNYEIIDNIGRVIMNGQVSNTLTLDLSNYSLGIYHLKLHFEKRIATHKILLQE